MDFQIVQNLGVCIILFAHRAEPLAVHLTVRLNCSDSSHYFFSILRRRRRVDTISTESAAENDAVNPREFHCFVLNASDIRARLQEIISGSGVLRTFHFRSRIQSVYMLDCGQPSAQAYLVFGPLLFRFQFPLKFLSRGGIFHRGCFALQ